LNFEGGGERSIMDGDGMSEGVLTDIAAPSLPGLCNRMVESVFEYGSRVGGWRLLRLSGVKVCLLAVAKAVERNPEITRAFVEEGHEIVSHGYRWLDYQTIAPEIERERGRWSGWRGSGYSHRTSAHSINSRGTTRPCRGIRRHRRWR